MRALELTVYECDEDGDYLDPQGYFHAQGIVDVHARVKRLTDAELAAEWQYQDNRCGQKCEGYGVAHDGSSMGSEEDEIEKLRIVYRFATLPHYDEAMA